MSRPQDPLALKLKPARFNDAGKLTHKAVWFFRWNGKRIETGFGEAEFAAAQEYLRKFLNEKHAEELRNGNTKRIPAHLFPICDALTHYAEFKVAEIKQRGKERQWKELLRRLEKLMSWWGERPVTDISEETCAEYKEGRSLSTAQRELDDLKAALSWCIRKDKVEPVVVHFTPAPKRKARHGYFTREQAAKFVRFCYRYRGSYTYTEKRSKKSELLGTTVQTNRYPYRHLIPFFLAGVYTGTRSIRLLEASYIQKPGRPWIDLEAGIFYREAEGELVPGNKDANLISLPTKLWSMMKRWRARGDEDLCPYFGDIVESNRTAYFSAVKKAFGGVRPKDLNRHALRHTCATWLCMKGVSVEKIGLYLSCSPKIIIRHYGHWHPDYGGEVSRALSSGGNAHKLKKTSGATVTHNLLREMIVEYAQLAGAPEEIISLIYTTPDEGLMMLRGKLKACIALDDFSAILPKAEAA